ncbi:MAG: SRPBCC family protein [Pseudomonadota bacterium]
MTQVSRAITLKAPAADVWAAIGPFQSIADWHPAVATSTREDIGGVEHRRLALEGGGEILEKHLGAGEMSYSYAILESPLPVADYRATITVAAANGAAVVVWTSTFEATADGAEDVIAGIYDAGFASMAERFGH